MALPAEEPAGLPPQMPFPCPPSLAWVHAAVVARTLFGLRCRPGRSSRARYFMLRPVRHPGPPFGVDLWGAPVAMDRRVILPCLTRLYAALWSPSMNLCGMLPPALAWSHSTCPHHWDHESTQLVPPMPGSWLECVTRSVCKFMPNSWLEFAMPAWSWDLPALWPLALRALLAGQLQDLDRESHQLLRAASARC